MTDPIRTSKDLPRRELMVLADETLKKYPGAVVHFKFTCDTCGARCTLSDPNVLYETGQCYNCGQDTTITQGRFMVMMQINEDEDGSPSPRKDKSA